MAISLKWPVSITSSLNPKPLKPLVSLVKSRLPKRAAAQAEAQLDHGLNWQALRCTLSLTETAAVSASGPSFQHELTSLYAESIEQAADHCMAARCLGRQHCGSAGFTTSRRKAIKACWATDMGVPREWIQRKASWHRLSSFLPNATSWFSRVVLAAVCLPVCGSSCSTKARNNVDHRATGRVTT